MKWCSWLTFIFRLSLMPRINLPPRSSQEYKTRNLPSSFPPLFFLSIFLNTEVSVFSWPLSFAEGSRQIRERNEREREREQIVGSFRSTWRGEKWEGRHNGIEGRNRRKGLTASFHYSCQSVSLIWVATVDLEWKDSSKGEQWGRAFY